MPLPGSAPGVPQALFGTYFVELARFFRRFNSYRTDKDEFVFNEKGQKIANPNHGNQLKFQVIYGQPRAAYRRAFKTENKKMRLPVINFWCTDWTRRPDKEPITHFWTRKTYNEDNDTIFKTRAPSQFDLNYQVSIWTPNVRERDHFIAQFIRNFPRNELSLIHYPDVNQPEIFWFMPLKIDAQFVDETELEELGEKDTRDIIRTTFNIIGQAVVPYESTEVPVIKTVYYRDNLTPDIGWTVTSTPETPVEDTTMDTVFTIPAL